LLQPFWIVIEIIHNPVESMVVELSFRSMVVILCTYDLAPRLHATKSDFNRCLDSPYYESPRL